MLKIANLESFHQLTKLQLSNNVIEKIENLDQLVHLTWLGMSYYSYLLDAIHGSTAATLLQCA